MKFPSLTQISRRRRSGLSILEMLIAMSIGVMLLAAMATFAIYTARGFVSQGNYADLDRASRNALDTITRDIRQSRSVTAITSTKLTLANHDSQPLVLEFNTGNGQFTRTESNKTTVLLTQCEFGYFTNYIRVPANNWQWYPVNTNLASATKLIDVNWKCSRKIISKKFNTESVQTAKIVIRN